jgi:protein-tyrosine-phosphatase
MPAVIFVCTANQIRSPFAQELFKQKLAARDALVGWNVESAGTWAADGLPATAQAVRTSLSFGLNLHHHQSRVVTAEILRNFDLILTMEQGQKEALCVEFREVAERVFLLSEMVGERFDVADPIGGGAADYQEIYQQIDQLLEGGFERIVELASAERGKSEQ